VRVENELDHVYSQLLKWYWEWRLRWRAYWIC